MTSMQHVERLRASPVPFLSYLDAARRLMRLALPGVLVHVPLATLTLTALTATAGDAAAVVDQRLQLIGNSDTALTIWTVVVAVVAVAGQLVVFPATVLIAAGHLVDRPVPPVEALRAVVRRLPSLLVLLLVGVLAFGAIWAARAGVRAVTDRRRMGDVLPVLAGQGWLGDVLLVAAVFAALPGLLAVPAVLLHGCGGLGSIRRAYRLTKLRFLSTAATLAFGVVLVPGAAAWTVAAGLDLLPGALASLGWGPAGTVLVLAVTPFQAAVVTRQFLHCMAWRTEVDDTDLTHGLPDGASPGPVRVGLVPVALVPGLLFGGVVLVNPFGRPEITETNVTESWVPQKFPFLAHERRPVVRPFDLRALHTGRGPRLIAVMDGADDDAGLLACADPSCGTASFEWAEPRDSGTRWEPGAASARLPDGRLLLTTWASSRLELLTCEATGCVRSSGAVATTRSSRPDTVGVALAVRRGGGPVVAHAEADPADGDRPEHDVLAFVLCADPSCARPERRQVARLERTLYWPTFANLAVAVGPDDRPVAARYAPATGHIQVISCQDAACHRPITTSPVPPAPPGLDTLPWTAGLALAVRPDGRPVIAYRDPRDQMNKLLDCRTPDCAQADARVLGAGGEHDAAPALVLDHSGRPLVAYESSEHRRLMLAVCTGARCEQIAVSKNENGFGERLAMTLNADGNPAIAWIDHNSAQTGLDWNLHVTTPLNLTPSTPPASRGCAPPRCG
ncbi:hypothetical protein AB0C28_42410 [Nonomuraea sp. NPDC048892]|uniref:hypothetical protein n=1 Tax=Nonomuraea sp. NPDC048892 TaxID=3154624 RepID=UPI0033CA5406